MPAAHRSLYCKLRGRHARQHGRLRAQPAGGGLAGRRLHREKRALAESILAEGEVPALSSTDDLVALIRRGSERTPAEFKRLASVELLQ